MTDRRSSVCSTSPLVDDDGPDEAPPSYSTVHATVVVDESPAPAEGGSSRKPTRQDLASSGGLASMAADQREQRERAEAAMQVPDVVAVAVPVGDIESRGVVRAVSMSSFPEPAPRRRKVDRGRCWTIVLILAALLLAVVAGLFVVMLTMDMGWFRGGESDGSTSDAFRVLSGSAYCHVSTSSDGRSCVTDGDGNHGNNEACTVEVLQTGLLSATEFQTESGYDYLTIGGTRYQGTSGPSNLPVTAGTTFSWRSDYSVTYPGWTVCYAAAR